MKQTFASLFLCLFAPSLFGQQPVVSGPVPQSATIIGVITDTDGSIIPDATLSADGSSPQDHQTATSTGDGSFVLEHLSPAVPYHVHVQAKGFLDWTSQTVTLTPGQQMDLAEVKLAVGIVETTVSAVSPEQLAVQQVKSAEKQRVLGIVPNFYVVYDQRYAPLSTKLKYQLALRASTDVASIAAAGLLAGINQASGGAPTYVQGAKGYGQRFGAAYAGGATTIFIGGAILPSLLHQDPRYFYQGTGTKKSRMLHAMAAPFEARSDKDGHWEFNYSSIGGDLISGALSEIYYPPHDRGPGLVFGGAAISTGGRIANALAQEFIFRKFTTHSSAPTD
ncbi:MAG: carboxypeptidase-like regulatory domain-containing protein [Edaphobacter sp.]|uniref:carboxypeptidase-like regulatory domain-containing protein n=1 Tax=Edaphobacter sp. TaxID=1934404 RepID=UPI0023A4BFFF|nr:carboxypeptidase-like regulatory domain-containing protein [Edaphobacter sp.]MDE1176865.1 carboxypeptidase-like regulatory domain-containing protein [Edaphobacter sp.]